MTADQQQQALNETPETTNLVPKIVLVATGTKWLQLGVLFRNKRLLCILYVQTYN